MERRSAQEMTALLDVSYVVCYGHFPSPEDSDASTKDNGNVRETRPSALGANNTGVSLPSPDSALGDGNSSSDGNPFGQDDSPSSEDNNPFSEDSKDSNPFTDDSKDSNPFAEDGNPFGEESEDENNPFREDTNPFSEDDPDAGSQPREDLKEDSTVVSAQPMSAATEPLDSQSSSAIPAISKTAAEVVPTSDPYSPLSKALTLKDAKKVSPSHAKEILSEAFNLTKLDLNRLVDEMHSKVPPTVQLHLEEIRTEGLPVSPSPESYPILFLKATVGSENKFTTFSSTSATNTIEQSLTLTVHNMYNDTLLLEVWSANVLPLEEPQTPPKLDFLGRIMTGSIRRKKDESKHSKGGKSGRHIADEEHQANIKGDSSHNTSFETSSPEPPHEQTVVKSDVFEINRDIHNGDSVDHGHSLDISDSISISSEVSNDPLTTSTPRGRSSSFQHLEATNAEDSSKKKGFRNSFKSKFKWSSKSNLRKSNLSLNTTDSPSPNLSRRPSDAVSMQSETSIDLSTETNGKGKLDRESSKSSLSISSFTRRTFSMRVSSKKVTNQMKRFGSVRGKKHKDIPDVITTSYDSETEFSDAHHLSNASHENSSDKADSLEVAHENHKNTSNRYPFTDVEMNSPGMASRRLPTPRPMRPFKNLMISKNGEVKDEASPEVKSPSEKMTSKKLPNNPSVIQEYLTHIGKAHLQAERLAHVSVPLKNLVGDWVKEGWIPMTLVSKSPTEDQLSTTTKSTKKKKSKAVDVKGGRNESSAKVLCKMHVRLLLPQPVESELSESRFDTYNSTYSKLVNLYIQTLSDLSDYKGSVGVVGKILLDQLIFFSRVSVSHQKLVSWLVLAEKTPSDSTLLHPLLMAIKEGLQGNKYITAQKLKLGESLSRWVRHVMAKEFEMLHSSFPSNSHLVHLPRLEHFLRCFNTIEEDTDLRILFDREMNLINFPSLTDQLKGTLAKNAEIWIEALNKEPLKQVDSSVSLDSLESNPEDAKWLEDLRRAGLLTKPIDDFLVIGVHTYQPIFMIEMGVDYLYWVIPKFLTAALHLISKTHKYPVSKIKQLPKAYIPSAAQAAWKICSNISEINRTSVNSKLPIHLIERDFRTAFSNSVLQWLTLSESLSLEEIDSDLQQEKFAAIDPIKGYSHSAVSMVDILKAIMSRLQGLCWPGGLRPSMGTLARIAKQIVHLSDQYAKRVTAVYTSHGGAANNLPPEVCVVVRNVEHVCNEARLHLDTLASWAKNDPGIQEEFPDDEISRGELKPETHSLKLQGQIDSVGEKLLEKCLPKLEVILRQGVSCNKPDYVIEQIMAILRPIEDQLYFAEPLLYELWHRIFKEAEHLMAKFEEGNWRDDLRRLSKAMTSVYTFLTDKERVGFQLQEDDVQKYEKMVDDLKMSSASSASLIAMYYKERYAEQCKEVDNKNSNIIVANVTFSKDGLRVYIAQAPGNTRGVLIKARVEPQGWFPGTEPQKTKVVKTDLAVFDETLHFDVHHDGPHGEMTEENAGDGGGVLILQVRTPSRFTRSTVHYEAIVPLATVQKVSEESQYSLQHLRIPLTRPWNIKNYKALRTLESRVQGVKESCADDFLKAWHTRWEAAEAGQVSHDSLKLNSNFLRATSLRLSSRRRGSMKETPVK